MSPEGELVINSSMVDLEPDCECKTVRKLPFNDIALEVGNAKTANVVAMGYIAKLLPEVPFELIKAEVEKSFAKKPKLIPVNMEAIERGYHLN